MSRKPRVNVSVGAGPARVTSAVPGIIIVVFIFMLCGSCCVFGLIGKYT